MVAGLKAALPRFKGALAEWDAGRGYLNFEENTVDSRGFYDEVTHRHLTHIKTQVDTGDLFASNHPIPGLPGPAQPLGQLLGGLGHPVRRPSPCPPRRP